MNGNSQILKNAESLCNVLNFHRNLERGCWKDRHLDRLQVKISKYQLLPYLNKRIEFSGIVRCRRFLEDGYETFTMLTDVIHDGKKILNHLWIKTASGKSNQREKFKGVVCIYKWDDNKLKLGITKIESIKPPKRKNPWN